MTPRFTYFHLLFVAPCTAPRRYLHSYIAIGRIAAACYIYHVGALLLSLQ